MKRVLLLFILFEIIIVYTYPLPHKRRSDYPLDQDCHLCHAVIIEAMNRIGNVMSVENTRNVLGSICETSSFEGYELRPDEIRVLCNQFVKDNLSQLQIAILQYRMKRPSASVDELYCNTPNFCPHGWKKPSAESGVNEEMEDEL